MENLEHLLLLKEQLLQISTKHENGKKRAGELPGLLKKHDELAKKMRLACDAISHAGNRLNDTQVSFHCNISKIIESLDAATQTDMFDLLNAEIEEKKNSEGNASQCFEPFFNGSSGSTETHQPHSNDGGEFRFLFEEAMSAGAQCTPLSVEDLELKFSAIVSQCSSGGVQVDSVVDGMD